MANPERSTEIRWYFKGPIPEGEVNQWFNDNPRLGKPLKEKDAEEREDLYLVAPKNTYLSPKLRGGKLEIKSLENPERIQEILGPDGRVIGKGEMWNKWKWRYAMGKKKKDESKKEKDKFGKKFDQLVLTSFMERTSKKRRVKVWKKRWQRKFRVVGDRQLEPVPMDNKNLPFGILAELTKLKVMGEQWWTIAFEVFGDPDKPIAVLQNAVNWLMRDYPGPPLNVDNSYSYPAWLFNFQ